MDSLKDRLPAALHTDRLVLTTPTMAHAPAIAQLANNRRIHEVMSRLPFPYSEEDARLFIEEIVPGPNELCYAILLGGETFVGIVGLTFAETTPPELGYWLGEPFWGKGYATEAAAAVVAAARKAGIPVLRSRALFANSGSRNVLRKVGFAEVGETIDSQGTLAGQRLAQMRLEFGR
ncbi:GNAT family N-acetyltransferase [Devosia lacusdianchii]|jgi:RimJ/RimL family protein N-acetyltransferase|uniref:GNAT family N-acetyltransferase n=1 Tax=Devosia lacusdianchii TaxID=2917991 RepID=UPI001F055412|nr:GNAT family N-acetyltransferase [Devosia sp. JXJ CY 41]